MYNANISSQKIPYAHLNTALFLPKKYSLNLQHRNFRVRFLKYVFNVKLHLNYRYRRIQYISELMKKGRMA